MGRVLLLFVVACLAGCPASDSATPDGSPPSDSDDPDGPQPGRAKLTVAWATHPASPGETAAGHEIEDVRFRMENLKVIVDVDPTDTSTTKDSYKLHWDDEETPPSIVFGNALPGRYTSVVLKLDEGDGEDAFQIRGELEGGGSFKIDDNMSLSISTSCNVALAAGAEATLTVDIDLQTAIDAIDFSEIGPGGGVDHHIDAKTEPAAMAAFRTALQQAFTVRGE